MADALAVLAKELADEFNVKCMYISNAALLTYDTTINYADEVQYIWKSSWSLGKCLYIASRYFAFVDVFLHLRFSFDSSLDPKQCRDIYNVIPWTITVGVVIAEAILIARTFAIYSRSYKILIYLVCLRLGTLIPSMKLNRDWTRGMQFTPSPAPTLAPCVPMPDDRVKIWLDFLFISIFDCNIVALTLYKALSQWTRGLSRHPLVTTLYRDGIGYFAILCMVSTSNVILLNVEHDSVYFNFLILFQRVLHAILSSRIIINVRKVVTEKPNLSAPTDPLVFGAATTDSQPNDSWRMRPRAPAAVLVSTDTHRHIDGEGYEMSWTPVEKLGP